MVNIINMIVHLTNGKSFHIGDKVAKILREKILETQGAKQWQIFSNEKDEIILMINLNEVTHIIDE